MRPYTSTQICCVLQFHYGLLYMGYSPPHRIPKAAFIDVHVTKHRSVWIRIEHKGFSYATSPLFPPETQTSLPLRSISACPLLTTPSISLLRSFISLSLPASISCAPLIWSGEDQSLLLRLGVTPAAVDCFDAPGAEGEVPTLKGSSRLLLAPAMCFCLRKPSDDSRSARFGALRGTSAIFQNNGTHSRECWSTGGPELAVHTLIYLNAGLQWMWKGIWLLKISLHTNRDHRTWLVAHRLLIWVM